MRFTARPVAKGKQEFELLPGVHCESAICRNRQRHEQQRAQRPPQGAALQYRVSHAPSPKRLFRQIEESPAVQIAFFRLKERRTKKGGPKAALKLFLSRHSL